MFRTNKQSTHLLCWFLTVLILYSPGHHLLAEDVDIDTIPLEEPARPPSPDADGNLIYRADTTLLADPPVVPVPDIVDTPLDVTYLLPQACLVVSLRPQAILASSFARMMPIEVLQAVSLQQTGLDPLQLDRLLLSVEPPAAGAPNYAVMGSFVSPVVGNLHPQLTNHTTPNEQSQHSHLKSNAPLMPSFYFPRETVLLATPEATLQKYLSGKYKPTDSSLHDHLLEAASDDVYVALDVVPLRPLINGLLMQKPLPPQLQQFNSVADLVQRIELRMNFSHPGKSELVVESNNDQDAQELLALMEQTFEMALAETAREIARLKQNSDPVQQAMGRYKERMMNEMTTALKPQQEGSRLVVFRLSGEQGQIGMLGMTAVSGILVALLLPAVQAAREAARRTTSMNNMKQINLALHNYADNKKFFPAQASFDGNGRPLLSWRVHILPYLEKQTLYEQFQLEEPWDSEHNRKLIAKMPAVYADPSSAFLNEEGRTNYLGAKGEGMFFDGSAEGTKFSDIRDGTSNSIMLVQVNNDRATTWTKPDDWEFDPKNPLTGLVPNLHPGVFLASFADAHVQALSESIDFKTLKAYLTIAGGEEVQNP